MLVCLASTSPARLMLLRQSRIEPITMAPEVDEGAVVAEIEAREERTLPAPEHVLLLAEHKATDVAERIARDDPAFDGIVIGGDSMFELDGTILGKPHTADVAVARWRAMRGRTGVLHSGHAVARVARGKILDFVSSTAQASVSFSHDVTDDEISAYVASGEPLHVAGAFTVDGLGAGFIDRVEGDPSTVVGMSLSELRRLVRRLGVEWPALWSREA